MSTKTICDICNEEIKDRGIMIWAIPNRNICKKCWLDKNKWPEIHKVEKEKV